MDDNEKTRLDKLRSTILDDLMLLIETVDIDPEQKFNILLASARAAGNGNTFEAAYDSAKKIEISEQKVNAYLDLLEAIDLQVGDVSFSGDQTDNDNDSAADNFNDSSENSHQ